MARAWDFYTIDYRSYNAKRRKLTQSLQVFDVLFEVLNRLLSDSSFHLWPLQQRVQRELTLENRMVLE